jgi:hypothetical protein
MTAYTNYSHSKAWNSYILCWKDAHFVFRLVLVMDSEYYMIYRGPVFLAVVLFGSSPTLPVSKLDCRHTGRLRKRDKLLTGEGGGKGVGEESNHTTARKPLVL